MKCLPAFLSQLPWQLLTCPCCLDLSLMTSQIYIKMKVGSVAEEPQHLLTQVQLHHLTSVWQAASASGLPCELPRRHLQPRWQCLWPPARTCSSGCAVFRPAVLTQAELIVLLPRPGEQR